MFKHVSVLYFSFDNVLFWGVCFSIGEVIAKFAQLAPQERAKRKLDNLEVSSFCVALFSLFLFYPLILLLLLRP